MRRESSDDEVALGVECALPVAFVAVHRRAPRVCALARLFEASVRFGVSFNKRLVPGAPRR